MLLVSDTGSPGVDQLVITTGLIGLTAMEVKLTDLQKTYIQEYMVVLYAILYKPWFRYVRLSMMSLEKLR